MPTGRTFIRVLTRILRYLAIKHVGSYHVVFTLFWCSLGQSILLCRLWFRATRVVASLVPDTARSRIVPCPKCGAPIEVSRSESVSEADLTGLFQATGDSQAQSPGSQVSPPPLPSEPPNQSHSQTKTCPFCAEVISAQAIKCKHCGSMLVPIDGGTSPSRTGSGRIVASQPPKDPMLMAILSGCCIAGLGQVVLGQTLKGIFVLIGTMLIGSQPMASPRLFFGRCRHLTPTALLRS